MTRSVFFTSLMFFIVSLVSCKSGTDIASEIVVDFSSAVSTSDSISAVKYYPATKLFYNLLPQIGKIEVSESKEVGENFVVVGQSSYYDKNSNFIQQTLTFWVKKSDDGFFIFDSKGLLELPTDLGDFPYKTGALNKNSKDVMIGQNYKKIISFFWQRCLIKTKSLNNSIEKVSLSWNAEWGTPKGKCTIKNTLPFTVKNVKYKITYYNGDNIVGSDDGTAAHSIDSGDLKSFTFYSSGVNGYRVTDALIEFDVPEKYATKWVLDDYYTGNEFNEYLKE